MLHGPGCSGSGLVYLHGDDEVHIAGGSEVDLDQVLVEWELEFCVDAGDYLTARRVALFEVVHHVFEFTYPETVAEGGAERTEHVPEDTFIGVLI